MIIAIIILIVFGIGLSLWYGLSHPKLLNKGGAYPPRKYQHFVTYLLAMLAVFIGAFLALYISNWNIQKMEREYLVDLLLRANTELSDESSTVTMFHDYFESKSPDEAERRMNANPVQDIFGIYILIDSPEFSKYITPSDAMIVQQFVRQKERIRGIMNNPDIGLDDRIKGYFYYSKTLDDIRLVLDLESQFIQGQISYKELLDSLSAGAYFINNDELQGYFDEHLYGGEVPLPKAQHY